MTNPRFLSAALVLALLPAFAMAQDASETRVTTPRITQFGVDYSLTAFQEDLDPWHMGSVSLTRRTSLGSVIGRVNVANRFSTSGAQVEADAYPRLSSNVYAYVSIGYSQSDIFPDWRSGAELFTSLPQAWEASIGYRQLRFSGSPVTLVTGALGKYTGNYWLSLRPYVRHSDIGTSGSASLTTRRYFADGDHYVGARVGFGSAPPDQVSPDAASLSRENSFSASLQGSGDLTPRLLGLWTLGYEREDLSANRTRTGFSVSTGVKVRL